jgi:hypothetical protein
MSISLVYMALLLFAGPGMGRDPKVILHGKIPQRNELMIAYCSIDRMGRRWKADS